MARKRLRRETEQRFQVRRSECTGGSYNESVSVEDTGYNGRKPMTREQRFLINQRIEGMIEGQVDTGRRQNETVRYKP